jgi:hypothetical protein
VYGTPSSSQITSDGTGNANASTRSTGFGPASMASIRSSTIFCTAEASRRKGFQGGLTVLGAEPHLPYDRPPLSEFVLGDPAARLDVTARTVHTASGRPLWADLHGDAVRHAAEQLTACRPPKGMSPTRCRTYRRHTWPE